MCAGRFGLPENAISAHTLTVASLSHRSLPSCHAANDNWSPVARAAKHAFVLAGMAAASTAALILSVLSL